MVDAWTLSPNHYAYVAVTAHFEAKGQPVAIILDIEIGRASCRERV